jgi:uncharacterized protein (TIGR02147 family)
MKSNLFEFTDYREFLERALHERGKKKALAEFIPCQTTFLSNVMAGGANLSLEHAMRVGQFLNLNEIESHYFMLIVHYGKAGTRSLENYYRKQIEEIQVNQNKISSRIASHETIPIQEQVTFYNSWLYVAIHILCAVPEFQSRRALRDFFHLPSKQVDPLIDFMVKLGILVELAGKLTQGSTRIHLPKGSPFLVKHHSNWRMRAIQSMDYDRENDLHYTMVMSLSKKDVDRVKQIIFESISKTDQLLKETGDEIVYSFCMDWFQV